MLRGGEGLAEYEAARRLFGRGLGDEVFLLPRATGLGLGVYDGLRFLPRSLTDAPRFRGVGDRETDGLLLLARGGGDLDRDLDE